ncbi:peptidase inhibitor family I36 protein [Streptomyces synnematoformans]|uniref:Peptidase inhibitor family I36 n=1 Tax=Streptomyces synnematoformans TaxID=415721 RepID=A0ABN2ZBL6_9ACTN
MNKMRMLAVGAALLTTAGIGAINAPAASAHYSQCPNYDFCIWDHSNYEGAFMHSRGPVDKVGDRMNDRMTSFWNRSQGWFSIFEHDRFGGYCIEIGPGASRANIGNRFNDQLTSFWPGRCTNPVEIWR